MSLSADRFRATMGHLAAGVTVVTVLDGSGTPHGMTVSAVTSLSLDPPMLLVCIDRKATIHDLIVRAPAFGVSILSEEQEDVARRFADKNRHALVGGESGPSGPMGLPAVAGALAHLECSHAGVLDGGDHSIVTATVEWSHTRDGAPLCYFRSKFVRLPR
jgi:flavin reductase (DIM6/NTAB) family NADH-FMN oxidoreductase RutF